jgi:hypothetical protein
VADKTVVLLAVETVDQWVYLLVEQMADQSEKPRILKF